MDQPTPTPPASTRRGPTAGQGTDGAPLRSRTKAFALRVLRLYRALPRSSAAQIIGKQLLRSALSVGANYRAVCRAHSKADFAAKMGIVLEEADEIAAMAAAVRTARTARR